MKRANSLSSQEIPLLLKDSRKFNSVSFYVRFKVMPGQELPKFAFIAAKKIFKKAVDRNLAKRRGREVFDMIKAKIPKGNYAVFLQAGISDIDFKNLINEATSLVSFFRKSELQ